MACNTELDSSDSLHHFGSGDLRELTIQGIDRSTWESITGYAPQGVTLADLLCDHLTYGSQATGADFTRPLTCGSGRVLEINLAGERIWNYTLSGMGDALAQTVIETEWEALRDVYRAVLAGEYSEDVYRRCLGGLKIKYQLAGSAETYMPSGDPLLPRLTPIVPQTTKTESWPTNGNITSGGQDLSWSQIEAGGETLSAASGVVTSGGTGNAVGIAGYAFGGNDQDVQITVASTSFAGNGGMLMRQNGTSTLTYYFAAGGGFVAWQVQKRVAGTRTALGSSSGVHPAVNDVMKGTATGSTIAILKNGSSLQSVTDTAIASGLYTGIHTQSTTIGMKLFSATDNLTSGTVGRITKINQAVRRASTF